MEPVIADAIPFTIDPERLARALPDGAGGGDRRRLGELAGEAGAVGRPKAAYVPAYIEDRGGDWVAIGGVKFKSRVLRVNLDRVHRVFPFVATCGRELEDWAQSLPDALDRYWADQIMETALSEALGYLRELMARSSPGPSAVMNPGSLSDWPLEEQRPLFDLFGQASARIGVELTDSCLMIPKKTVSGLRFPVEESFENCQLCPRENCPGRRAPHDPGLYDRRYR